MRVDLGTVEVNQLQGNPAELWTMPSYPGYAVGRFGQSEPALRPAAGDGGAAIAGLCGEVLEYLQPERDWQYNIPMRRWTNPLQRRVLP